MWFNIEKRTSKRAIRTLCLYMHGGSMNHGCEAIVRSLVRICGDNLQTIRLFSKKPFEDELMGIAEITIIIPRAKRFRKYSLFHFYLKAKYLLFDKFAYIKTEYYNLFHNSGQRGIFLSIGGDNYCGYGMNVALAYINKTLNKQRKKTVLFGCSIEPELLKDKGTVEDMKRYSLITARESITYQALQDAGVTRNTYLFPDPAFVLEGKEVALPANFIPGKMVGVNVSPLIQKREQNEGMAYANYRNMVAHILNSTEYGVVLIPHVVWDHNNDLEPLTLLYNEFKESGRVCLIDEGKTLNCMELKYIFSKCRLTVAARTHASIAAYSTCVPTLVVGYSVKARGIAKDIFGTSEQYVIPVQSLALEDELTRAFQWLEGNQESIRKHLEEKSLFMMAENH